VRQDAGCGPRATLFAAILHVRGKKAKLNPGYRAETSRACSPPGWHHVFPGKAVCRLRFEPELREQAFSHYHFVRELEQQMRGADERPGSMFSYVSLEERVPADHPLRSIRQITDRALAPLSPQLGALYVHFGRPSVPPEQVLRALLLQALYSIRNERQLMEQLDYNLLFRWFVGLGIDDPVWSPTTFTKNRDRLLRGDIAQTFFEAVRLHADSTRLLSDPRLTVDDAMLSAWSDRA